ncbi:TetR family transcriptional regulator [Acinetobacter sp. ANC 4558]|uniref:TetR/AcrR family transcriptional regulator n=1 Tax=Acinetobacter sp. ANC 4558 TaxID=1977876 RepID=UPI000A332402|nr:TetR/AcrR family transcriptional regulator [Acinetobacter sp. ANC 4558]OTG87598.1 TetR family transcriptional regulator [Acinetobacter sp. ANC 4558]
MPRVSKQVAAQNRKNIESITSQMIRDKGFAVSVADLMKTAGLTHGGFYKHFKNKDELIDIACKNTFQRSIEKWEGIVQEAEDNKAAFDGIINRYLSAQNLENPGKSCPLSCLTIDVARESQDKPVKESFHQGVEALLEILSKLDVNNNDQRISKEAMIQLSLLSGALTLARSVHPDLGLSILENVKSYLCEF